MKRGTTGKNDLKNTLAYKILRVNLIILVLLLLIGFMYLILKSSQEKNGLLTEEELEEIYQDITSGTGELAALRWSGEDFGFLFRRNGDGGFSLGVSIDPNPGSIYNVVTQINNIVTATGYFIERLQKDGVNVTEDAYSMSYDANAGTFNLNLAGSEFSQAMIQGIIIFLRQSAEYCNATLIDDLIGRLDNEEVFDVVSLDQPGDCGLDSLDDLLNAISFSNAFIQWQNFSDLELAKNEQMNYDIQLDDYYICLHNITFNVRNLHDVDDPSIRETLWIQFNSTYNTLRLAAIANYTGVAGVGVEAVCNHTTILSRFNVNVSEVPGGYYDYYGGSDGTSPVFKENCSKITLEKNTDYSLPVSNCFFDPDGDTLLFGYGNVTGNISINGDEANFIITPATNWTGAGYFYLTADDISGNITSGRVDYLVVEELNVTLGESDSDVEGSGDSLEIQATPSSERISLEIDEGQDFSVENTEFDGIKWILDGEVLQEGSRFYSFSGSESKSHSLTVEITKGSLRDSKSWRISVLGEGGSEESDEESPTSVGTIILYLIIVVVLVTAFLIVWLFIIQKNKADKGPVVGQSNLPPGVPPNSASKPVTGSVSTSSV